MMNMSARPSADEMLEQVIDGLRAREIPEFPNPSIFSEQASAPSTRSQRSAAAPRRPRFAVRVAAAILVGVGIGVTALLLNTAGEKPVFADVQKALGRVQTVTYTLTQKVADRPEETSKVMLLGRNLARAERPDSTVFIADFRAKKMVHLVPENKSAVVIEGLPTPPDFSVLQRLANLDKSAARVQPGVPERTINHKKVGGFVIDEKDGVQFSVWVDPETNLPLRMEREAKTRLQVDGVVKEVALTEVFSDIVFNRKLDPKLFALTVPKDYTVEKRVVETVDEQKRAAEEQKRRLEQRDD